MFPLRTDTILKWMKAPSVLDAGCTGHAIEIGSPRWLHGRLGERFPLVVGIDISAESISALHRLGFTSLYGQSAESFGLRQTFDTIVAGELIEHLSNPGLFLEHARAHLDPMLFVVASDGAAPCDSAGVAENGHGGSVRQ